MRERVGVISRIKNFAVGIYRDHERVTAENAREATHLRTTNSLFQAKLISHEEYLQRLAQGPAQPDPKTN